MRIKEFTGKTTQEAIDNGLAELGVTIADVHVDVLRTRTSYQNTGMHSKNGRPR